MISLKNRFIFIHIPKTGGNSIEEKLYRYSDDKKKKEGKQDGVEEFEMVNKDFGTKKHATLNKYRSNLHGNKFNGMFKFTCIRNPWERAVSFYFSPHSDRERFNLNDFKDVIKEMPPADNFIHLEGDCSFGENLDFIMKFENIQEDFKYVCERLNIPHEPLNVRNRSNHRHYSEYYDEEAKELVRERFRNEIEFGGYEFEDIREQQESESGRTIITLSGFGGSGLSDLGHYLLLEKGTDDFKCLNSDGSPMFPVKHERYPQRIYNTYKTDDVDRIKSVFLYRNPVKALLSLNRRFQGGDMRNHIKNIEGYPQNWPGNLERFSEDGEDHAFLFYDFFKRWQQYRLNSPVDHDVRMFNLDNLVKSNRLKQELFNFVEADASRFVFKQNRSDAEYDMMNTIVRNRLEKMFENLIMEMYLLEKHG